MKKNGSIGSLMAISTLLAATVFGLIGCSSPVATPAESVSPARTVAGSDRNLAFQSFNNAFYQVSNGVGFYKNDTTGSTPGWGEFWKFAQQIELAEDAYARTGNSLYKNMVVELCAGAISLYGTNWCGSNGFNDDIAWMVLAFERAYSITGNQSYLNQATGQFNVMWSRAHDSVYNGIYWQTTDHHKNACALLPAGLAAIRLYWDTRNNSYRDHAYECFWWVHDHLYDAGTGHVADHSDDSGNNVDWSDWTYNDGTFVGLATSLYKEESGTAQQAQYNTMANITLAYVQNHLTGQHLSGILNDEYGSAGGSSDSVGFKGIFLRYLALYAATTGNPAFNGFLSNNRDAAWTYRNSRGITWAQWWHRTSDNTSLTSWECTAAAVATQVGG